MLKTFQNRHLITENKYFNVIVNNNNDIFIIIMTIII